MMAGRSRDPTILFEDDDLLVAVKPTGLPTANAPRGAASLFTWLQERQSRKRPGVGYFPTPFLGIVSRLDAPVSGVVVVAKTRQAAAALARQFRERTVGKHYLAVVTGRFPAPLGAWVEWQDEIAPPSRDHDPADTPVQHRAAHVRCRVVRRAGEVSLVELEPSTGRRHQLRVQLASRGCPIVGDRTYGSRLPFTGAGIALHASRLVFDHPGTGDRQTLEADVTGQWRQIFPSLFPITGRR
jgi:23S rRNA pseudouridine1911/1915/1917 synthase